MSIDNAGGALAVRRSLQLRFSEAMDPASLQLGGDVGAEAVAAWSQTVVENDTLTLSPPAAGWSQGQARRLVVDAKDRAGNALARLHATYSVEVAAPGFGNFQDAAVAVGQADLVSRVANEDDAATRSTLRKPYGAVAFAPDGTMFVADSGNNRVLAFPALPGANGGEASFVLGQVNFQDTVASLSQGRLSRPLSVAIGNGKMVVADYNNNRVLIYDPIPTSGTALPTGVLGQVDFDHADQDCTRVGLRSPESVFITPGGKLIVADSENNRVLVWLTVPSGSAQLPDLVLGQRQFDQCAINDTDGDRREGPSLDEHTLFYPTGVWSDDQRLAVVDTANNRVLVWNNFPAGNFAPANLVLGQGRFDIKAENDNNEMGAPAERPTIRTMSVPGGNPAFDGTRLAISDYGNSRVMVWNSFPTESFQNADVILGQKFANVRTPNDDAGDVNQDPVPSPRVMFFPNGVAFRDGKLIVTDQDNHRLLVFEPN